VFDPGMPKIGVGYVQPFHEYVDIELAGLFLRRKMPPPASPI
jgi:hypothetical protein